MSIADEEFAHMNVQPTQAEIDAAATTLALMPQATQDALVASMQSAIDSKKSGAELLAIIAKVIAVAEQYAPEIAVLLGL